MNNLKVFPIIIILVLLLTAFVMPLIKKRKAIFAFSMTTVALMFFVSLGMLNTVNTIGSFFIKVGPYDAPWGIAFHIGHIEALMALLFTGVTFMISWYGIYSIHKDIEEAHVKYYFTLVHILLASLLGVVFTNDLFNGYVFIEAVTLSSCGIIIIKNNKSTSKATFKYLIMSVLGSGLLLMGIAFLYAITGQLNMVSVHNELVKVAASKQNIITISLSLIMVGLGVKSALFPLHTWLPDAHGSAPTTSSALLSSLVLKAPVVLLIKIIYQVYGLEIIKETPVFNIILFLGVSGMILGSVYAIFQKEIKRVVAYSSVAQMGYIFFGIGLGTEMGLTISLYHVFAHALTKAMLFLCVGSMIEQSGYKYKDQFRGIGKEMPVTLGAFTLGALSMVGIPPFPGFISKWYFSIATINANQYIFLAFILASSLLNAVYYLPIVINGYFGIDNVKGKIYRSKYKPIKEVLPLGVLAGAMIFITLYSGVLLDFFKLGLNIK
jgi:multicomponent Na+:H+ antiporter subunit D